MGTLEHRLAAFHHSLIERTGPANAAALRRSQEDRTRSGLAERACQPGETAPDFALLDQDGTLHTRSRHLALGPIVLVFYRGGWSPLCELTLRAWQEAEPALAAAGAHLLAISPDDRPAAQATAASNWIRFPLLSDASHAVTSAYRLDYVLPREVQALYAKFNDRVGKRCCGWRLPLTATYVVAPDGVIAAAHLDARTYKRMEPQDALAHVAALRQRRAA
jgi:peroxiredoxin